MPVFTGPSTPGRFLGTSMQLPRFSTAPSTAEIVRRVRKLGVARPRDLPGISRSRLRTLCEKGVLERIGRGLYVSSDLEASEHHELALVARLAPGAVVCLISALRFHELTTQVPHSVWIAIANKAHAPQLDPPRLEIVRMSGPSLTAGVLLRRIDGVPVRVFDPARTVVDRFRFRNRVGQDVALEALREFRRRHRGKVDRLWEYAGICRIRSVLRPYLESI